MSIIKLVKNKKVFFQFYKKDNLWYKTEDGFEFPVPVSDTGDGVFLKEDKASAFMRYIRIHLDNIKKGQLECTSSKDFSYVHR